MTYTMRGFGLRISSDFPLAQMRKAPDTGESDVRIISAPAPSELVREPVKTWPDCILGRKEMWTEIENVVRLYAANGNEIRVDLPEGANDIICVVPDVESEHVVVANGSDIMFVNRLGDVDYSVSTEGKHPLGIDILTNEEDGTRILVAAYANGSLGRYDPDTGSVIGMTDISSYINHLTPATFQPDWDNGYLYIQFDRLTDVINMDTWYQEAAITDCFGHHIPTDRFYCTSSAAAGEEEVGYFRHYTVQELVDRAYAIVGEDAEMPEYLRARYGL